MYYTSKLIKLNTRIASYLELIQSANNRYKEKTSTNETFDFNNLQFKYPLASMNYRFNEKYAARMKNLSTWLVIRLQTVITEFNEVNINQLKKELNLSNNEVSTIDL